MYLTLGQAAKKTGKSKATISKYIRSGKLSYINKDSTGYKLDPAEVFRVFTPVNVDTERSLTPIVNTTQTLEVELLREMLERERQTVDYLRNKLDQAESERVELRLRLENIRHKKRFFGIF
tara:strand:+ start:669 stop:1031 length:363 start_codon:yes stop_codon:yes gene_type:complete